MEKAPKGKCDECTLKQAVLVPSEINDTKILYLAEAPGFNETQEGRPLVGIAGRDLMDVIEECGGKREDASYINAVTCRPTKTENGKVYNRTPTDAEIAWCNERMIQEIDDLSPEVIVCMGKVPYLALGGNKVPMKNIVCTTFDWRNYDVIVSYHPAAIAHSGGKNSERGREIRNKIKEAVEYAMQHKHVDKQLRLVDTPLGRDAHAKPIVAEMNKFRDTCEKWWTGDEKCRNCKQRFYCYE